MEKKISEILERFQERLPQAKTKGEIAQIVAGVTGPNGELTALMKLIPTLDKSERPAAGKLINQAKGKIEPMIAAAYGRVESAEMARALGPKPDISMPNFDAPRGTVHPLTLTMRKIAQILCKAGFTVFALDFLKGVAAVAIAGASGLAAGSDALFNLKFALTAAAVLGHIFPLFAGFRGGKGVATLAGAVLMVYPPSVLLCLATFLVVFLLFRYVSLASMTAGILLPVYTVLVFGQHSVPLIVFCCAISVLLLVTHRKNIGRLLHGTESKIRFGKQNRPSDEAR